MGELTRIFKWKDTSLGPLQEWPVILLGYLSFLLSSKFPMLLWWGDDLIQFYNDAYRPSLGITGKHPRALGQRAADCWPEVWETVSPLIERTLQGESVKGEDQNIPIFRNGRLEEVYWTFGYTPVRDNYGKIKGVLVTVIETTEKIQLIKRLAEKEERFRNMVLQAPVAMCVLRGPEYIIEVANSLMYEIWGSTPEVAFERPVFTAIPTLAGQGFEELLAHVLRTGEEYRATETLVRVKRKGIEQNIYVSFVYQPVRETDGSITGVMVVATDVSEERNARRKSEVLEERTRLAIEATGLGTFDVDLTEGKLIGSERFEEIFGVKRKQKWHSFIDMIHPADQKIRAEAFENAITTGTLFYEVRIIRPDKTISWIRVNGRTIKDSEGRAERLIGTVSDITVSKYLNKQKDDFIGIASHELKTPVTTISAYAQLLARQVQENTDTHYLPLVNKLSKQVERLNSLINDLLDATKMISGKLQLNHSKFCFDELVKEAVEDFRLTTTKQIVLRQGNSCKVWADKDRVEQTIFNLLSNAVKFSPVSDRIDVNTYQQGDEVIFEIRDYGIGIEREEHQKIFEQFYRSAEPMSYTFPGIGLGLYISSEIIKREGGRMGVESTPGKGSTFSFTLPCAGDHPDT